jgi:hypothetical protein
MNLVAIESPIGLDRLATREEIRSALLFWYRGAFEPAGPRDDRREVNSDFTGRSCKLDEDTMWFVVVGEPPDSMSN